MSEPEMQQDGYQIEDGYEDGYYDGTYNKKIPHDWGEETRDKYIKDVCKRCGQTRDKIVKKIPTSDLVNAVMAGGSTDFSNMREFIDEAVENDWCLSDDELVVKDIIE